MWEDRAHKLQDELKLKHELAAMWRRSAEKDGDVGGEAEAVSGYFPVSPKLHDR